MGMQVPGLFLQVPPQAQIRSQGGLTAMRVTVTRVLLALIGTVTLTSIVVPMVLIDLDSALGEPGTIRNRIRDSYVQDGSGVQWSASSNNVGVVDALANTDRRDGSQSGVRTGAIDSSASTMQGRVADQQQQARPAVNTNDVEQPCRCKTQPGQDWVGGDLGSSNAHSPAQCCQLCEDHPQCYSWTYKEETSECFLKEAHLQMVTGSSTLTSGKACKIAPPPPAPTPTPPRPKAPSRAHAAEEVRAAMKHAWDGYTSHCFGQDELYPVSGKCGNWLGQVRGVRDGEVEMLGCWLFGLVFIFRFRFHCPRLAIRFFFVSLPLSPPLHPSTSLTITGPDCDRRHEHTPRHGLPGRVHQSKGLGGAQTPV